MKKKDKAFTPSTAFQYVCTHSLDERTEKAELLEPIIAQDCMYSYEYAKDILQGRFELGEPQILKSEGFAVSYATHVLKRRWPEAEPMISKHSRAAYQYARDVIGGRWIEGEAAISSDLDAADWYIMNVIEHNPHCLDYYEMCFRKNTVDFHRLPQWMQDTPDIQTAYFKATVLK